MASKLKKTQPVQTLGLDPSVLFEQAITMISQQLRSLILPPTEQQLLADLNMFATSCVSLLAFYRSSFEHRQAYRMTTLPENTASGAFMQIQRTTARELSESVGRIHQSVMDLYRRHGVNQAYQHGLYYLLQSIDHARAQSNLMVDELKSIKSR